MAELEPKSQEIPFRFGLDLSEDDEGTPSGAEELENFDFDQDGAAVRRHGFTKATSGPSLGQGTPEILLPVGASGLVAAGTGPLDVCTLTTLFNGARVQQVDSAVDPSRSWICVVATTVTETSLTPAYEAVYWVVSLTTGLVQTYGSLGTDTWGVQLAAVRNSGTLANPGWNIYYASGASTPFALKVVKLALGATSSTLGTPSTVAASLWDTGDSMLPFSVRQAPNQGATYVAYVTVTTGQIVAVKHDETAAQTASLSLPGATVSSASVANVWLTMLASGTLCVFYQPSGTNLNVKRVDAALAAVIDTATLATTLTAFSGVVGVTAAEESANKITFFVGKAQISAVTYDLYVNTYDFNSTTLGTPKGVQRALPLSRAEVLTVDGGTRSALLTGSQDTLYPNGTVLAFSGVQAYTSLGAPAYDELAAPSPVTRTAGLSGWTGTATTRWLAELVTLESAPSGFIRRIRVVKCSLGTDRAPRVRALLGGRGVLAGGETVAADGLNLMPVAFNTRPQGANLVANVGGNLSIGTYSYRTVLELTDITGTIQSSPPSDVATVTLAAAGNVDVTAFAYTHLSTILAGRPVRLKVYRNTQTTPAVFNLVLTVTLTPNTWTTGGLVTINDNTSDANLITHETIYTTGGAVTSELVPALSFVAAHRDRLFGIDALDPFTIRFTTELSSATAPRWNAALTFRVDNTGGKPLALASMNDKLLVLQRDQICVVTGQGPDGTGSGAFSVPEAIARVGVEPSQIASVVETPVGVFFAHRSGIQLITPDLQVVPVGKALGGKTVGTDIPVLFGRYIPTRSQVWFQTQPASPGAAAPIYVFDLRFNRWVKWTGASSWMSMLDVLDHNGVVYAVPSVTTGGGSYTLMQLSAAGDYRDENPASLGSMVMFSQVVATPWFRGDRAQELRLWRVHVSGRKLSQNGFGVDMVLQVYTQDERKLKTSTSPDQTYTWLGTDTVALAPNWLVSARAVTQRCRAFRCRLTLTPTNSAADPYYTLSAITYDFGVLRGRGKQPAKGRPAAA